MALRPSCLRGPDCFSVPTAGGTLLTLVAPFVNIQFLGSSLTFMMVRFSAHTAIMTHDRGPQATAGKTPVDALLLAVATMLLRTTRRCTSSCCCQMCPCEEVQATYGGSRHVKHSSICTIDLQCTASRMLCALGPMQSPDRALPHGRPVPTRVYRLTGVRVGAAAPVREPQLPGHLQLHGAVPAVGAAGLLRHPGLLPRRRPAGHGRRCAPAASRGVPSLRAGYWAALCVDVSWVHPDAFTRPVRDGGRWQQNLQRC